MSSNTVVIPSLKTFCYKQLFPDAIDKEAQRYETVLKQLKENPNARIPDSKRLFRFPLPNLNIVELRNHFQPGLLRALAHIFTRHPHLASSLSPTAWADLVIELLIKDDIHVALEFFPKAEPSVRLAKALIDWWKVTGKKGEPLRNMVADSEMLQPLYQVRQFLAASLTKDEHRDVFTALHYGKTKGKKLIYNPSFKDSVSEERRKALGYNTYLATEFEVIPYNEVTPLSNEDRKIYNSIYFRILQRMDLPCYHPKVNRPKVNRPKAEAILVDKPGHYLLRDCSLEVDEMVISIHRPNAGRIHHIRMPKAGDYWMQQVKGYTPVLRAGFKNPSCP